MAINIPAPGSPDVNNALGSALSALILQQPQAPALPALAEQGIDQEVNARTSGLSSLIDDTIASQAVQPQPRLVDSIIRALAGAVSVGTSRNPSEALARQLIQQQAQQERELQRKQTQKDKELAAKTTVTKAKVEAGEQIRKELREDKQALTAFKQKQQLQQDEQTFRIALADSEQRMKERELNASREVQLRLATLREDNDKISQAAGHALSFDQFGVDPEVSFSVSRKQAHNVPPTPEEAAEIARAYRQHEANKTARSLSAREPQAKLVAPMDVANLRMKVYNAEKNTPVLARYGDEGFPVEATNPRRQLGMPVMKSDVDPLAGQVERKQTDAEATRAANKFADRYLTEAYSMNVLTPELKKGFESQIGPRRLSISKLSRDLQEPALQIEAALRRDSSPAMIQKIRSDIDSAPTLSENARTALKKWMDEQGLK